MNTTPIRVPVTHLEAPEDDMLSKRPTLAKLTEKKKVKLRLSQSAFNETCQVLGALAEGCVESVQAAPSLTEATAELRGSLCMLLDCYRYQLQPHVLAQPLLLVVTLSRCEAYALWRMWVLMGLSPAAVPGFAEVMDQLDQLLRQHGTIS